MPERQSQDAAAISKLRAEIDQQGERLQGWEAECERLQAEVERAHERMELECFRAVAAEREKWKAREERMARQLQRLEADELSRARTVPVEDRGVVTSVNGECRSRHERRQHSTETPKRVTIQSPLPKDIPTESPGRATTPSSTGIVSPEPMERMSTQSSNVANVEQVGGVPTLAFGGVSTGVSTEAYTGVAGGASTRPFTGASTGISTGTLPPPGVLAEALTGSTLTSAALLAQQLPHCRSFQVSRMGRMVKLFKIGKFNLKWWPAFPNGSLK